MKRTLLCTTAFLLFTGLALSACAPRATPAPDATPEVIMTEAPAYLEIPATPQAQALEALTVEKKLDRMMPVFSAYMLTLGAEGAVQYQPSDPAYFWNTLLYTVQSLNPLNSDGNPAADAVVSADVMLSYAKAAFSECEALPPIPDTLTSMIAFDSSAQEYRLQFPAVLDTNPAITRYAVFEDGSVIVEVGLLQGASKLSELRFSLQGSPDALLPYCVSDCARASGESIDYTPLDLKSEKQVDLDGDGNLESLSFTVGEDDSFALSVMYNGKELTDSFAYLYNAACHIGKTFQSDQRLALYVTGDTGSDDYFTYVYHLTPAGTLEKTEIPSFILGLSGDGNLLAEQQVDILGSYSGLFTLSATDDFRFHRDGAYSIWLYDRESQAIKVSKDGLQVNRLSDGKQLPLSTGDSLLLLSTDESSYTILELENGDLVRLAIAPNSDDWGYVIDGSPESDWFTELRYAG